MRFPIRFLSTLLVSIAAVTSAHADAIGTTVNGTLKGIYYEPGGSSQGNNLFSTSSATIGDGTEFIFAEYFSGQTLSVSADFGGSYLNIYTYSTVPNFIDHEFVFSDPTFYGVTYLGTSTDVHVSFSGNTITVDVLDPPVGNHSTTYNQVDAFLIQTSPTPPPPPPPPPPPSSVPEPSSILLLGTGILATAGTARRKFMTK